jgi:hypothetical protein
LVTMSPIDIKWQKMGNNEWYWHERTSFV